MLRVLAAPGLELSHAVPARFQDGAAVQQERWVQVSILFG